MRRAPEHEAQCGESHFPLTKLARHSSTRDKPIENERMNSHPVLIVLAIAAPADGNRLAYSQFTIFQFPSGAGHQE
jgi:hypothetical protein